MLIAWNKIVIMEYGRKRITFYMLINSLVYLYFLSDTVLGTENIGVAKTDPLIELMEFTI